MGNTARKNVSLCIDECLHIVWIMQYWEWHDSSSIHHTLQTWTCGRMNRPCMDSGFWASWLFIGQSGLQTMEKFFPFSHIKKVNKSVLFFKCHLQRGKEWNRKHHKLIENRNHLNHGRQCCPSWWKTYTKPTHYTALQDHHFSLCLRVPLSKQLAEQS